MQVEQEKKVKKTRVSKKVNKNEETKCLEEIVQQEKRIEAEIKQMIERIPMDIEKMRNEIDTNMNTFLILDKFQFKFSTDDLNRNYKQIQ